jgi:hypothetical protein
MVSQLRLYLSRQASSPARYVLEQVLTGVFGWIPTPIGMAARGVAYRLMLSMNGVAAIERGVRLRFASHLSRSRRLNRTSACAACPGVAFTSASTPW